VPLNSVVLDVMKPIKGPSIVDLAESIAKVEGVRKVIIKVTETDTETITMLVTVQGDEFDFDDVKQTIEQNKGVIRSVDLVVASSYGEE